MVYRMPSTAQGQFVGGTGHRAKSLSLRYTFPPRKRLQTRYILSVLELVRKNARFFLAASLAALGLRLVFALHFAGVVDDSRLYADIAMNWLGHGVYGITNSGQVEPTLSRLPGYPAFLAAVFAIFGWSNFRAVLLIQVLFDLGTCFLIADLARRVFPERAAKAAFLLAALCPFLANYAAAALTENLEIFFTALALDLAVHGFARLRGDVDGQEIDRGDIGSSSTPAWEIWLGCGLGIAACILLRPDGGILFGAIGGYWFLLFLRRMVAERSGASGSKFGWFPMFRVGVILTVATFAPLIPWTLRNLHTMHRFQPLAPRYATEADESAMAGFNRWVRTWIAEYTSVQEIYWRVPGDAIDFGRMPERAFDSAQQRQETEQVFADYNRDHEVTAEIDARFAALAAARIHAAPLRYYVWLPVARIADMWLRPRIELLPSDPRWWEFDDDPTWLTVSIVFGLINLAYVAMAAAGALRSREISGMALFVLFLALRSLFLGTLENPEPRYTLECYPVVILLAAALFIGPTNSKHRKLA
jgi:4-amino-4-deoxy-L-arabinose transferase-like glycosyltransferase